jgi:hypothetical protein
MEELLGAIVAALAELLIELLFELLAEVIVGVFVRSLRRLFGNALDPIVAFVFYLVLGAAFGGASLLLFPHPIFHPSRYHGISLVVSPLLTGLIMAQVGTLLRRTGRESVRIESFRYGFSFALGMAIIRFIFAS